MSICEVVRLYFGYLGETIVSADRLRFASVYYLILSILLNFGHALHCLITSLPLTQVVPFPMHLIDIGHIESILPSNQCDSDVSRQSSSNIALYSENVISVTTGNMALFSSQKLLLYYLINHFKSSSMLSDPMKQ